ncbi:non-heme iron oxygenase ferredoxin subunit [Candidatus Woesearchaeota archaeon]|nr:non-heme iron oxygenase ferredoxin subunit [Candidatus Woesearchaeota archaeon]
MAFFRVALKSELKEGSGKVVLVNGQEVALFNVNGEFFAITNRCPHRGGPLGEGELDGSTVTCPRHGWMFDVKSGKGVSMPVQVKRFNVKVEGEDVFVEV